MAEFFSSASQVDTYEACPRKWAWKRLEKIQVAPKPSAQLGTNTHTALERWLRTKEQPNLKTKEGKLAHALIPLLPPPQAVDPTNVEIKGKLQLGGISFVMVIDLWMPKIPKAYDHKTTGDFSWAKKDLMVDIQGTLYAAWGLHVSRAEKIDLQWNYVRTKGAAKTLPVIHEGVTGRMISERLSKTIATSKEMKEIYEAKPKVLDLPYNAESCEDFGGCPFKDRCNLTAKERLRSIMGIADKLKERKAQKAKATAPAAEVNPPEQADTEGAEEAAEEKKEAKGRGRPRGSKNKSTTSSSGFTLYINCSPIGHAVELASDRVAKLMAKLREEGDDVNHYKEVEYGKGVGTFSEALRQDLKEDPPKLPVVLFTSSFEQADMLQAFMAEAALVVR